MSISRRFFTTLAFGLIALIAASFGGVRVRAVEPRTAPWTLEQAAAWGEAHPWLVGCNFGPSTAINQLEMWQADTFDPAAIDRELGWAESLGFNSIRVFLHDLLWEQDSQGFLDRMEQFLKIADKHKIGVIFVPFDSVWDPNPKLGKQRDPKPHLHNSGWVQSPGVAALRDPRQDARLKRYLQGVLERFCDDRRIQAWDLVNEPDNSNGSSYGKLEPADKAELGFRLLRNAFAWAREVNPSQPLTAGVWLGDWSSDKISELNRFMLEQSDIISFHNYGHLADVKKRVQDLKRYRRPMLCTEYMARPNGSEFDPIMGFFRDEKIGAYNWGFVAGKTQTIYPWDSWKKTYTAEPPVWFHDIFRQDGSAYRPKEVEYIRGLTGAAQKSNDRK